MARKFKELTNFFIENGADAVAHTDKTYMAHGIGVYNDLKKWGCDEDVCNAGLFHSIYGTELFQGFTLPTDRRNDLVELIGEHAEKLAYVNCFMDRASMDAQLQQSEGPYTIRHRVTGESMELSKEEYDDLVTVHLCDWLEQVPRSQKWDYRREPYRQMAERLGGVALTSYDQVFAQAPQSA